MVVLGTSQVAIYQQFSMKSWQKNPTAQKKWWTNHTSASNPMLSRAWVTKRLLWSFIASYSRAESICIILGNMLLSHQARSGQTQKYSIKVIFFISLEPRQPTRRYGNPFLQYLRTHTYFSIQRWNVIFSLTYAHT